MTLSHFVSNSVHINIRCKNKDIFRTNKPKDNKIIFFHKDKPTTLFFNIACFEAQKSLF